MLNFFPVAHRANSSQHLCSLGHMHLDHCSTIFKDHTTAGHENLSLEDDSKIYSCHLPKQGFPFRTKPCLCLHPPWTPFTWTRSWGSSSHLNLIETIRGLRQFWPSACQVPFIVTASAPCIPGFGKHCLRNLSNAQFCLVQAQLLFHRWGNWGCLLCWVIHVAHITTDAAVLHRHIL